MDNFVVDTKGHCFLCLRQIPSLSHPLNLEHYKELPPEPSIYSLQYISRYLKMDMRTVFSTNGANSPDLLAKVERAKLKAELCEECASMTERLSELYRQLEKIEMEMSFYVNDIHGKLVTAETDQLNTSIVSDFTGKLEIVNALRNEAAKKCSDKLDRIAPVVKVQNQSQRQLNARRPKKRKSRNLTNSFSNTSLDSSMFDAADSSNLNTEVDVKLENYDLPTISTSTTKEYFDKDYNDCISNDDSDYHENSTSAELYPNQQPGTVSATSQRIVNPETGKHKCKICSKEFSNSSNFWKHYKAVHLKIRYKCSLCSKQFTDQCSHSRHFKSDHLGIRFKCKACGKTFGRKVRLQGHIKRGKCGKD